MKSVRPCGRCNELAGLRRHCRPVAASAVPLRAPRSPPPGTILDLIYSHDDVRCWQLDKTILCETCQANFDDLTYT